MKPESKAAIITILDLDGTTSQERRALILKAMDEPILVKKPRPISRKEAAEILGVHSRTIGRYEKMGLLASIRITSRKIRFDRNEVEALALRGATGS